MTHPQTRTRLRSLTIAVLIVLVISCVPFWQTNVSAQNVIVSSTSTTITAGTSATAQVTVTNQTGATATFNVSASAPTGWTVQLSNTTLTLNNGTSQPVTASIAVPAGTSPGSYTITVTASGAANANGFITVTVPSATATSTTGTITISPQFTSITGAAGQSGISTNITLTNNSGTDRTFVLSALNIPSGISVRFPVNTILVRNGTSFQFPIFIDYGTNAPNGQNIGVGTIRFTAQGTPAIVGDAFLTFSVSGAVSPTVTPTANVCGTSNTNDPGNDKGSARRLLVNEPQDHGICTIGDEDWFVFGAVAGKVYTFDVFRMEFGLDLSLELYDADDHLVAQNDDYFARTPVPGQATATPGPSGDLRPQINSWRAPASGDYFLRVRDNLNIGGNSKQYSIVVVGEGYGPTPQTVYEVCRDLYEEDGLPEQARLITSNEAQPAHALCPVGDADWVKFFGKAGKTYYIYTDTRPYGVNVGGQPGPEPGADTVLGLFDRDGITLIASNDDIESPSSPSQSSLDSEIRFTPSVDGFYFAQVKNSGDIGNQFIKYDLVLKLCIPGQECGRSPITPAQPTAPGQPAVATPTATFSVPPTITPQPTVTPNTTPQSNAPTPTASFAVFSQPNGLVEGRVSGFVDPAFRAVWERTDRPLAELRVTRSWVWGPAGPMAKAEPYAQVGGGLRQVQYFDKARMEINNPGGERNSRWFVTTGLLVMELVSGRVQIGANEFVQRGAADIPLAGDATDEGGPRYASFAGVTGEQAADRTGQLPLQTINRAGQLASYGGPSRPQTRLARYVPETRHNIPQVFWDYLNARGTVFDGGFREDTVTDWVFTMGYPISEPYWATVRVDGVARDVLIQPFERRVLTYSPDNPSGWQVEQGNVGRHYYQWRYGEALP